VVAVAVGVAFAMGWLEARPEDEIVDAGSLDLDMLGELVTDESDDMASGTPASRDSRGDDPPPLQLTETEKNDLAAADAQGAFDCLIEPNRLVAVGSSVVGVLEALYVERGDDVREGQTVARLESAVEEAAVEVARHRAKMGGTIGARKASLELGQKRKDRAQELFEHEALSLDLREEVETEAELAKRELQQAREEQRLASLELTRALAALQRRVVRSPVRGVVTERLLTPGEVVDEETILKIAQLDPLRVEVILPSALFGTVAKGMRAAITPEIPGDTVHVAEVKIVDRMIDAASGTFGVQLELPNADHAIPGGLHCQVRFLSE